MRRVHVALLPCSTRHAHRPDGDQFGILHAGEYAKQLAASIVRSDVIHICSGAVRCTGAAGDGDDFALGAMYATRIERPKSPPHIIC